MSHGRVVCLCGRVVMQCRCPGPHQDTVKAGPCSCAIPGDGAKITTNVELRHKEHAAEVAAVERALGKGCGDFYCRACGCNQILINEILRLREELAETEVLVESVKAQRDGANNRIKYLEDLIREAAGKALGVGS